MHFATASLKYVPRPSSRMLWRRPRLGKSASRRGKDLVPWTCSWWGRQFRRFVLVEAKDLADEGPVPRLLKYELGEFREAVANVREQVGWFRARLNELKSEYGIPLEEDYSVEGVVVVNSPRLWMYTTDEATPVVDVKCFVEILKSGNSFLTYPVA